MARDDQEQVVTLLREKCRPWEDTQSIDQLLDAIGDARIVLLGEASHGTHEYYTWRAKITRRLIEKKGFQFIGVEGDWPTCYQVNRHIKGYRDAPEDVLEVLEQFTRWPTWMWGNWEIAALADWLRKWNRDKPANQKVGFYGLDVYSLWESLDTVMNYLQDVDPEAARAT